MRKTILVIVLALIMTVALAGCGLKEESPDEDIDTGFRVLERIDIPNAWVIYDKTTGVMYWVNYHGAVTPIINADGSLRIWEGAKMDGERKDKT